MNIFNHLSIKYKLISVVLLTATIGLTVAGSVMLSYERVMQKKSLAENMHILAQVIALRSAAALSFDDKQNALANLETLKASDSVHLACMYDSAGNEFVMALMHDSQLACPEELRLDGEYFSQDYLEVFQSIQRNGTNIGSVYLRTSLEELDLHLQQQILLSISVLFVSLVISFALTARMQRKIYSPIIQLGAVAAQVTNNNNYSIRAPVESKDEVGETVRAFNDMLHEIELDKKELERLAYFDPLTKLPNRRMFSEELEKSLLEVIQQEESKLALIFMDVDRFKQVNDTLGHDVGDLLLKEFAKRIKKILPETASVYRLGGDEFTVIIKNVADAYEVEDIADAIIEKLKKPLVVAGEVLTISTSMGGVLSDGNDTAISIMKNADIALYHAKENGRGNYQLFGVDNPRQTQ